MGENYLTVTGESENVTVIERSKFICKIKGVENEDDAKNFVAAVKKEHSLATHNCYAYIADEKGLVQKFSDDGEPQGTAGIPMLETLKSKGLSKVAAVVTRYFGGIKLGAGGLVGAYSQTAASGVAVAKISTKTECERVDVFADYSVFATLEKHLRKANVVLDDIAYGDGVECRVFVPCDETDAFCDMVCETSAGKAKVVRSNEKRFEKLKD